MDERGVRTLPADASTAARAHTEAVWRASDDPDASCRCSGMCHHGQAHGRGGEDDSPCSGRMLHTDRYPGSLLELTTWHDEYQCDTCGEACERDVDLPAIPWGERTEPDSNVTVIYEGVRHPNFPEDTPQTPAGDGLCRACGGYAFAGLLCEGCRREGWSDADGIIEEPDNDHYEEDTCDVGV